MDRLNQLRPGGGSGRGSDVTLDTSTPPSEAYMSANESSKYFSLSDSFDITPIKDVSLASVASTAEPDHADPDELMSNLSPITKKDVMLDSYKFGKQIEAANILSGGVDIFDNENSYDGDELVIDDNENMDDKLELDKDSHLVEPESDSTADSTHGAVEVASKDTEVVLQIDGNNVDAIDIGNGLYLYRKTGQEELAAVQIITENDQAPTFKFLKVRENAEGNLEVYEEFEVEVSKEVPVNEAKPSTKNTPHDPIKGINKATSGSSSNKVAETEDKTPTQDIGSISPTFKVDKDVQEQESKTELNINGKLMKFNESRKSPVVGSFTPMTYHSTPNKEGKPLTKTMVDQQLHPSRHSDNVKKRIEVHTDGQGQTKKVTDETFKHKSEANSETTRDVVDCAKSIPDNIVSGPNIKKIKSKTTINYSKIVSETKDQLPTNKKKQVAVVPIMESETVTEVSSTSLYQTHKNKPAEKQNKTQTVKKLLSTEAKPASVISMPAPEANNEIPSIPEETDKKAVSIDEIKTIETKKMLETKKPFDDNQTNIKPETDTVPSIKSPVKLSGNYAMEPMDSRKTNVSIAKINATNSKVVMETDKLIQATNKNDKTEIEPEINLIIDKKSNVTRPFQINTKALEKIQENPKLQYTEEKDVNVVGSSATDLKVELESEKPIQALKIPEQTQMKPEAHALVTEKESNAAKRSEIGNILVSESDKSMSMCNVKSDKPFSVLKEMDLAIPQTSMLTPVAKKEPTKVLQDDEMHINKAKEPTTLSKTEKNKVTMVMSAIASTGEQMAVLENKIEATPTSQINRFLPVAKVIDPKIGSKSSMLIGQKPVLTNDKTLPVTKQMEPVKVYSKSEKIISTSKSVEAKAMSSYYQVNPITKGIELKTFSKTVMLNPAPKTSEPNVSQVAKPTAVAPQIPKSNAVIITSNKIIVPSKTELKKLSNKEITNAATTSSNSEPKSIPVISINNNHSAVPFGKWTEANRQEFLNKFKDIKPPPAAGNTKQIKNSNDLNRIDILKKIDSQRSNNASIKIQDKSNVKDTVFSTKITPPKVESKIPVKNDLKVKTKPEIPKLESVTDTVSSSSNVTSDVTNPESQDRREVNVNDLIGKAIVDMLNRPVPLPMTRSPLDDPRQVENKDNHVINQTEINTVQLKQNNVQQKLNADVTKNVPLQKLTDQAKNIDLQKKMVQDNTEKPHHIDQENEEDKNKSLDDIEMKMNKLHGIPFVERPPHELPKAHKTYSKSSKESTQNKALNKMLPTTSKQNIVQDNIIDLESDDEVTEHQPITGDIDLSLKTVPINPCVPSKASSKEPSKIDPVITENDFDKFARRNSKSYENCLTVNYDGKEPANVVQTVKEKRSGVYAKNEAIHMHNKTNLPLNNTTSQIRAKKISNTKLGVPEDAGNQNYQSKIHSAYQSALTAKLQMDRPISFIEDKPVKVVFMDANAEFVPNQLNVQGKELSPAKSGLVESFKVSSQPNCNVTNALEDKRDDTKVKMKHQRKQILNPVQSPEVELIQPGDLGFDESPKKKRKAEENTLQKSHKSLVHKKSYLLGRAVPDDKPTHQDLNPSKETINRSEIVPERVTSAVSAIDNLVKAAELLENQSAQSASPNSSSQLGTPVKRGRGRPRKYPLPEEVTDSKVAGPVQHHRTVQKKPRLIDAKPIKPASVVSGDESSDEEQMVLENWTMGKINENIVCPICNKLFRSENVVFKHVKHCTGVSPTRSDLEKRSPRRRRYSRESDNKSFESQSEDMDFEEKPKEKKTPNKHQFPDIKSDMVDIIVIEDTPMKDHISKEPIKKIVDEKPKPAIELVNTTSKQLEKTVDEKPKPAVELVNTTSKQLEIARVSEDNERTLKEIADEKRMLEQQQKLTTKEKVERTLEDTSIKKMVLKALQRPSDYACEFCGKTFRQLSYLVNHKLLHKKEQQKKLEAKLTAKIPVVHSCEVCKKQFRKLHHLVQHRIIHNPDVPARSRKTSSEQSELKPKESPAPKPSEDTSAGFRCEPCDKSFRKLHHLVEHRETHDGINRQKSNVQTAVPIEKPSPPPQCEICKKSFRKLHHLIEHKEQHHSEQNETSSEKSDDKSVQSSLSTRDIIHECSLCYMVFPNEHSLNKHFVNCQQKKKRQPKPKNKTDDIDTVDKSTVESVDENKAVLITIVKEVIEENVTTGEQETKTIVPNIVEKPSETPVEIIEKSLTPVEVQNMDVVNVTLPKEKEIILPKSAPVKRELPKLEKAPDLTAVPEKIKKLDDTPDKVLPKKISLKIKRNRQSKQKTLNLLPHLPEGKPAESSDDDEVRYMLNPKLVDETTESKGFMQVRSNKRNSLQIERPNFQNLMNRRTSLQHPPKIPRLKAKAVEPKVVPTEVKNIPIPITEAIELSTDSDDSDVKYSFPENVKSKPATETPKEKKVLRKSLALKRKSLGGIAKRKSLGKTSKADPPPPIRIIKKRSLVVEHRCDCGQLFNSAALLTRHTSLAHTPPRIRKRRSPLPEVAKPTLTQLAKPTIKFSAKSKPETHQPRTTRNSSVKTEADTKTKRKSLKNTECTPTKTRQSKSEASQSMHKSMAKPDSSQSMHKVTPKTRKSIKLEAETKSKPKRKAHSGVPLTDNMQKVISSANCTT